MRGVLGFIEIFVERAFFLIRISRFGIRIICYFRLNYYLVGSKFEFVKSAETCARHLSE